MQHTLAVYLEDYSLLEKAKDLASKLELSLVDKSNISDFQVLVYVSKNGLGLWRPTTKEKPFIIDFCGPKVMQRISRSSQNNSLLLKAIGRKQSDLNILDATAGFGHDAFELASSGNQLTLCEQSVVVHAILEDAISRAAVHPKLHTVATRMKLVNADSSGYMKQCLVEGIEFDIVYLDPMFPKTNSKALVKKELRILRAVVGSDTKQNLLGVALQLAKSRVVVKRMRKDNPYYDLEPSYSVEGKTNRFDVYL